MLTTLNNLHGKIRAAREACGELDMILNRIHKDRFGNEKGIVPFPSIDVEIGAIFALLKHAENRIDEYRKAYIAEGETQEESEAA